LAASQHSHASIEPFIWGLLPDNEFVLDRWAKKFQVSARNAFALISHVGEDCAGAVQFVSPERRDTLLNAPPAETDWLTETDVAKRLRAVRADASAGRSPQDTGQFSLAGAQPKTALLFDGQRWGIPSGRTPTTHILKPTTAEFDGHAENEHLCLRLANALGLPTADTEVRTFEGFTAIVVTRYDRVNMLEPLEKMANEHAKYVSKGNNFAALDLASYTKMQTMLVHYKEKPINRVHQEDICQALRIHPSTKYQNSGGPGAKDIVNLLRTNIVERRKSPQIANINAPELDVATFVDALVVNWLIGGTDAHAKNYSILISGSVIRLAPLYDIASILAYPSIDPRKAKLAMKIGDRYGLMDVSLSDWRKLSATCKLDEDQVLSRISSMARELPDRLSDEVKTMRKHGLNHRVIDVLSDVLLQRATAIAAM
jgi:serine/threonine-protein kinase HipA